MRTDHIRVNPWLTLQGALPVTAEHSGDVRTLIEQIVKAIVDAPDRVTVDAIEEDGENVLELKVAETDLGKVIGKSGRTARALRTLLSAAGMKLHKHYTLEILE
jgi:predicted RNA-binding protein YlqC (UPF0109 family)